MPTTSARYVLPEFTERTTHGIRTLDPYSKLFAERIVFLGTPMDDSAANDVIAQFLHLEYAAPDQDIRLYINSPGGSIAAMSAIYDTMQLVTCDVETTCLGQAVSTAAVLLAAGAPGKRMALPGARIVLQQPTIEEPVRGQPSDLAIHAEELLRQRSLLTTALSRHTGGSPERIAADLERDKILDATGAQAYGLVDHVVQNRKTSLNSLRNLRVSGPSTLDGRSGPTRGR
jgi:ATP-dependent Clp protease protease subunit